MTHVRELATENGIELWVDGRMLPIESTPALLSLPSNR